MGNLDRIQGSIDYIEKILNLKFQHKNLLIKQIFLCFIIIAFFKRP